MNYKDIDTEGITAITREDIEYARAMGRRIKLLGTSRRTPDGVYAIVAPFLVEENNPLYGIEDVYNAVFVHGNMAGSLMFYGSGAGKLPTASAVTADIIEIVRNRGHKVPTNWTSESLCLEDTALITGRFFVRVRDLTHGEIEELFGEAETFETEHLLDEIGIITPNMTQEAFRAIAGKLGDRLIKMIRIKD